jgi:predicted nuclease of predicted toxin-antitoxin system
LADEDLDFAIIDGVRYLEPAIDILDIKDAGLRGTKDPIVLEIAAAQQRIVISHDRNTMTRHFKERLEASGREIQSRSVPGSAAGCDR